jgi:hypothetical protein
VNSQRSTEGVLDGLSMRSNSELLEGFASLSTNSLEEINGDLPGADFLPVSWLGLTSLLSLIRHEQIQASLPAELQGAMGTESEPLLPTTSHG